IGSQIRGGEIISATRAGGPPKTVTGGAGYWHPVTGYLPVAGGGRQAGRHSWSAASGHAVFAFERVFLGNAVAVGKRRVKNFDLGDVAGQKVDHSLLRAHHQPSWRGERLRAARRRGGLSSIHIQHQQTAAARALESHDVGLSVGKAAGRGDARVRVAGAREEHTVGVNTGAKIINRIGYFAIDQSRTLIKRRAGAETLAAAKNA